MPNRALCTKCGGVLSFDDGGAEKIPGPAMVCHRGHRIELDAEGNSLLVKVPTIGVEQHIRLLHRQGRSIRRIARSLGCSIGLVREVIAEMNQP